MKAPEKRISTSIALERHENRKNCQFRVSDQLYHFQLKVAERLSGCAFDLCVRLVFGLCSASVRSPNSSLFQFPVSSIETLRGGIQVSILRSSQLRLLFDRLYSSLCTVAIHRYWPADAPAIASECTLKRHRRSVLHSRTLSNAACPNAYEALRYKKS